MVSVDELSVASKVILSNDTSVSSNNLLLASVALESVAFNTITLPKSSVPILSFSSPVLPSSITT